MRVYGPIVSRTVRRFGTARFPEFRLHFFPGRDNTFDNSGNRAFVGIIRGESPFLREHGTNVLRRWLLRSQRRWQRCRGRAGSSAAPVGPTVGPARCRPATYTGSGKASVDRRRASTRRVVPGKTATRSRRPTSQVPVRQSSRSGGWVIAERQLSRGSGADGADVRFRREYPYKINKAAGRAFFVSLLPLPWLKLRLNAVWGDVAWTIWAQG